MTSTRILCDEENSAMSFDSCASFGCNSLVCASDVLAKLTPIFILVILCHSTLGQLPHFSNYLWKC
jgi:exosortase/archaeosortase